MKLVNFFLAVLFLICISCSKKTATGSVITPPPPPPPGAAADVTVLNYNIHHANPPTKPGVIDINAIANVIIKQKPDVVALQEVDVYTTRSGITLHEAQAIASLTGMTAYFGKAIDYAGGEYGVAILSRFPMENMKNTPLPTDPATGGELRTLASVTVTLPGNKKIVVACTHLDAQSSNTNRLLQIQKILDVLKSETLPVIVAGDFNADPSNAVITQLDSYFTRSCVTGCGFTVPVINPTKTIDYIAFAPATKFSIVSHAVVDEQYASDHRPVKAAFNLK